MKRAQKALMTTMDIFVLDGIWDKIIFAAWGRYVNICIYAFLNWRFENGAVRVGR